MTKAELFKALESVHDDEEVFIATSDYDHDNDCFWGSDWCQDIDYVEVVAGQGYLRVEAEEFM